MAVMKWRAQISMVVCCWATGFLDAHPLNWTKLTLAPQTDDPSRVVARLEVDLSKFVGGYVAYHDLVRTPTGEADLRLAAATAMEEITVFGGAQALAWKLDEFIPPAADDDFFSAQPTPMAFARFIAVTYKHPETLRVTAAPTARLELPLVVRVQTTKLSAPHLVNAGSSSPALLVPTALTTIDPVSPSNSQSGSATERSVIQPYFVQGFTHIIPKGLDHVLFVMGLFLAGSRFRDLLIQVSIFTAAHTLALAAATIGLLVAPGRIVEPLIAVSILWLAVENLLRREPRQIRNLLIFFFGLLHGLGFASALQAIGLPAHSFPIALASFNVGVEVGQLGVLGAAYGVLGWSRNSPRYRSWVVQPTCALIALVASWWTIARAIG